MYIFPTLRDLLDTSHLFFLQTITSSKHHFLNFFCVSGNHWGLAPSLHSCFTTFCNMVHVHPFQVPQAPHDKPSHRHANGCKGVGLKCNLGEIVKSQIFSYYPPTCS